MRDRYVFVTAIFLQNCDCKFKIFYVVYFVFEDHKYDYIKKHNKYNVMILNNSEIYLRPQN